MSRSRLMSRVKREAFAYSSSTKYVARTVSTSKYKKFKTRIYVGGLETSRSDPQRDFDQAFLRRKSREPVADESPAFRAVDLFCGCGGLSLGAREACSASGHRFESVLAIDTDEESLNVYKANFTPTYAYNEDISSLIDGDFSAPITMNESRLIKGLGEIDLLLAGPPCQGHSNLRRQAAQTRTPEQGFQSER